MYGSTEVLQDLLLGRQSEFDERVREGELPRFYKLSNLEGYRGTRDVISELKNELTFWEVLCRR